MTRLPEPAATALRSAPLQNVPPLPVDASLDLAFIDADKTGYVDYWTELVPRVRTGGVLLVDNTLQGGAVVDPSNTKEQVEAIRRFNDHAAADGRVELVVLPVSDGLTMAVKR